MHARRARGGGACALGQLRAEAPSGAAGSLTGVLRASPAAAPPSSASSSASSSSSPPQLALLVMQPCGGEEEAAAAGGGVLPGADAPLPPSAAGGLMLFYELGPGDGEAEAGEEETAAAAAAGGESTASPEELEEEEQAAASSGEAAAAGGGCKSCTYQGCSETTTQVAKQRKPWMCKRHRNKMYKDKYKRKKSDQALGGGGAAAANAGGGPRAEVRRGAAGLRGGKAAQPALPALCLVRSICFVAGTRVLLSASPLPFCEASPAPKLLLSLRGRRFQGGIFAALRRPNEREGRLSFYVGT